jgi:hypothetical protein
VNPFPEAHKLLFRFLARNTNKKSSTATKSSFVHQPNFCIEVSLMDLHCSHIVSASFLALAVPGIFARLEI